jgi:RNA polymerase sigma factor (sigma-70 family)
MTILSVYLEKGLLNHSMEKRFVAAAQRVIDRMSDGSENDASLWYHQVPAFLNFRDYLMDIATSPDSDHVSPFCRIVLPPRTGKTVIGAKIIESTGLCTTFVVPTRSLIDQTCRELSTRLPGVGVGVYYGEKHRIVTNGVNVTTYATLQRHFESDKLPDCIRRSGLVLLDEAHHALTPLRIKTIHRAFDEKTIRLAITATPNYNESKRLCDFFPNLIHELELIDAFELGLLAPARMWVVEVDADASTIRFIAGDFEQETLGRLMSSSPFFKTVQIFRYSDSNINTPTLIACSSRQQAYDLWAYLKRHKPDASPLPRLLLGDTSKRERILLLKDFENGLTDTIIQVGVLIEGWNSPRCKLLLDIAPSLSRVRATQKYFRVMTRYEKKEARMVVILPKHLPRQPVLPIDLILQPGEEYVCGQLIESSQDRAPSPKPLIERTAKSPVKAVKVRTRLIASAHLARPKLDPNNLNQVREVLESCRGFTLNLRFGIGTFRRLFFNHPLFVGRGDALLRHLEVSNEQKGYMEFMARLFPAESADGLIGKDRASKDVCNGWCRDDYEYIENAIFQPNGNRGKPHEPILSSLNALCGGLRDSASAEEVVLMQEQIERLLILLKELPDRERYVLRFRLGLFGSPELTWEQIGVQLGVSKERIRQLYARAVRKLKWKYSIKTRDREPVVRALFEYPDYYEVLPIQF